MARKPKRSGPRWIWQPGKSHPSLLLLCWLVALEFGLTFALGGSAAERGPAAGLMLALALVILPLGTTLLMRPNVPVSPGPYLLLFAVLLLPLLQLVPLAPEVWTRLPGRGTVVTTFHTMGIAAPRMPLSLNPAKTWDAFLWLMVPAAIFIGTSALARRLRVWLSSVIVLCMVISLGLGALQMNIGAGQSLQFYAHIHHGLPIGFFANRNHQAIALAICLPLIAANVLTWAQASKGATQFGQFAYIGLTGLFTAGILMTQSRAGLVLGGLALMAGLALYFLGRPAQSSEASRRPWFLAVAFVTILVVQIGIGAVLSRFGGLGEEGRFEFWPLVLQGAVSLQPWGSGLGSFDAIFRSIEPISMLDGFYLNEAHNDYFQLVWEAGLVFPVLFAVFLWWFFTSFSARLREPDRVNARLVLAAAAGVGLLLLHGVVDYPLRTPALASVFAFLCGCMTRPPLPGSITSPAQPKTPAKRRALRRSKPRKRRTSKPSASAG